MATWQAERWHIWHLVNVVDIDGVVCCVGVVWFGLGVMVSDVGVVWMGGSVLGPVWVGG